MRAREYVSRSEYFTRYWTATLAGALEHARHCERLGEYAVADDCRALAARARRELAKLRGEWRDAA